MKRLFAAAALAALLVQGAQAAEISVGYGPEFAKKLKEDYGEKEGDVLAGRIERDLTRELAKAGVDVARVEVTILDARPSRPTFKQAGDKPGLDMMRSVSVGGMKLKAATPSTSQAGAQRMKKFVTGG